MNKNYFLVLLFIAFCMPLLAEEAEPETPAPVQRTIEDQRRDILRFGTETEIATLIQTLRNERVDYLDEDLVELVQKTRNRGILTGVFGFFGEMEKTGLEERAIQAIRDMDEEANETITAAVNYLGHVKAVQAIDSLKELINTGENRFFASAFRALGRAASAEGAGELADEVALFLLNYYENRNPGDEVRRELLVAMGETGSSEVVPFLSELVTNPDERIPLRMAGLDALGKIGNEGGMDAVVQAVSSNDPNVRASAVAALGPFSGDEVDAAILEAFRDPNYRGRIAAAQAAGRRQLESAVPFLRFRAENDEVPAVKDEAIKALGAINNSECMEILDSLFTNRRNSDRVRLVAAEQLLQNDTDTYSRRIYVEMEEAKRINMTPLYNGFIRIMATARSNTLEDIARRFISYGGIIEKVLALDLILHNEFLSLEEDVRSLLDERRHGASVARRAQSTLERLGLE